MTKLKKEKFYGIVDGNDAISQRRLGLKFKVSHQYIGYLLSNRGINYYKKNTKPLVTEKQKSVVQKRINKFSKNELSLMLFCAILIHQMYHN